MGLKDIEIKNAYFGKGSKILNEFLLPILFQSKYYDRITGYYTVESLLAISQGVEGLIKKQGKMRLIIGVHNFPMELVDATLKKEFLNKEISILRKEISKNILSFTDAFEKKRLATLAWMIEDGILEVKAASVKGEDGGIFHAKTLIFKDDDGNVVVAAGSQNETRSGLGGNVEQLVVLKSWESKDSVDDLENFFTKLWENNVEDTIVSDISEDTAKMILNTLGENFKKPKKSNQNEIKNIIKKMAKMPANFFVSGNIPALFTHQERAVIDALSRWPVRVLFADEVGLGKTFEVAATLVYLIKYCNIKRAVILTPKSVLQQWQDELYANFGLEMWLYNSGSKEYLSPTGRVISVHNDNPIGKKSPDLILMSSQFARGTSESKSVFEREGAVLPDLLVVDEAHSARISVDLSNNKKKTLMYKMLEKVKMKIPHFILATATPMLKTPDEYHAMLKLLGLPKAWEKDIYYNLSLRLISTERIPDISDAYSAALLLNKTIESMNPSIDRLDAFEIRCLSEVKHIYKMNNKSNLGDYVQKNWDIFKRLFIKLHPAHLLTVRNTRRALINIGYKFPVRQLKNVDIHNSDKIELFYDYVNRYLSNECFSIERARDPEKRVNIGFVRINYQQRVASSLYSCKKSLKKRYDKAKDIHLHLSSISGYKENVGTIFELNSFMDDQEYEESEDNDEELLRGYNNQKIDINELKRAASIECASLSSLMAQCDSLIEKEGDRKIQKSIEIALDNLSKNESVLLFSRYTDTIDALVDEFNRIKASDKYTYGIYIGGKSVIIESHKEEKCDKTQIKEALFSKRLKILFCSDAASEGLNLQAAKVLINVDVPWTPARLEQRIGRIARLGQVANEVFIYNVWYPNSIEARMYKKIQQRLEKTNLAIGEFPEVIAENIKKSILDSSVEDVSLRELKNIRNSYQTKALEQLWVNNNKANTISDKIRNELMSLCDLSFEYVSEEIEGSIKRYKMPDGKIIGLTSKSGMEESISLTSYPWKFKDYSLDGFRIMIDPSGNISGFAKDDKKGFVKHEEVMNIILNDITDYCFSEEKPIMLPETCSLDMGDAVEMKELISPKFWPFMNGGEDES